MDPEGIMLSEISQRNVNTVSSHFICGIFKKQTHRKRGQICDYQMQGVGEGGIGGRW